MFSNESIISGSEVGRASGTETRTLTLQSSLSFLSRFWKVWSGAMRYVVTHPLQAITAGLVAQNAVAMGSIVKSSETLVSPCVSSFPSSFIPVSCLNGQNGYNISTPFTHCNPVALAGDINGDGFSDFVLWGATKRGYINAQIQVTGQVSYWASGGDSCTNYPISDIVYVVFGQPGILDFNVVNQLDGINGFSITGGETVYAVSSAGDFNNDGIEDIVIVGDYGVHFVFGNQALPATLDLATLNGSNGFSIDDAYEVVSANLIGDFNGDGISDVILGAPTWNDYAGAVYVLFGHSGVFSNFHLYELADSGGLAITNGFAVFGQHAQVQEWLLSGGVWGMQYVSVGERLGTFVNSAGDFNGDGLSDILISTMGSSTQNEGSSAGGVYCIFGGTDLSRFENHRLDYSDGTNGFFLQSENIISLGTVRDFNGDGMDDFAVTTESSGGFVFFGRNMPSNTASWSNLYSSASLSIQVSESYYGGGIAPIGDFNHDGFSDFAVVKFSYPDWTPYVDIYYGTNQPQSDANEWINPPSTRNGSSGFVMDGITLSNDLHSFISFVDDVNRDGTSDIILAGFGDSKIHVVFGSLPASKTSTVTPTRSISNSGSISGSVSSSSTVAPSASFSGTCSGSGTISSSRMPSASSTIDLSVSPSSSVAPSNSSSVTVLASNSETGSTSGTESSSRTMAAVASTMKPSILSSITASESGSETVSASISGTVAPSVSPSVSISMIPTLSVVASSTERATQTLVPSPTHQISILPCDVNFRIATIMARMMTESVMQDDYSGKFRSSPTLLFNRITNSEVAKEQLRQATARAVCQKYLESPMLTPSKSKRHYV